MNSWFDHISTSMTEWIGTPFSVVVHTIFFIGAFFLPLAGFNRDTVLLVLTTLVSLEAIYLAIFIQMTVNRQARQIKEVGEDIDDIQEDVEDLGEEVKEISEDVEDISEDIDKIQEDQADDASDEEKMQRLLNDIAIHLQRIVKEVDTLKARSHEQKTNGM